MKQEIGCVRRLLVLLILTILLHSGSKAQFVTGRWYGNSPITQAPGYHLSATEPSGDVLDISGVDSARISGSLYHYYWFRGSFYYCIKSLECTYDAKHNEWLIKETAVKDNHLFPAHYTCLHTYRLAYSNVNGKDSLNGAWTAASFDDCGSGVGLFARTRPVIREVKGGWDSVQALLNIMPAAQPASSVRNDLPQMVSQDKLKKEQAYQQMLARSRTVATSIPLQSPAIKVEIWDNGVIDGDNISLYFNKELVVNRKRITAVPIVLELTAVPGQENELIMYANNLGDIPPNTAMMRVHANGKQYVVEISSDEHSNGIIRFTL